MEADLKNTTQNKKRKGGEYRYETETLTMSDRAGAWVDKALFFPTKKQIS